MEVGVGALPDYGAYAFFEYLKQLILFFISSRDYKF